jgi:phosphatidylglycerophosphate synthase
VVTEKHKSGEGEEAAKALPAAAILGDCAGDRGVEIWNETPRARLIRALARLGITRVLNEAEVPDHSGALLLFRADAVFDAPILKALIAEPGLVLTGSAPGTSQPLAAHAPPGALADAMALLRSQTAKPNTAGLKIISPAELGASYWHALRKREVPYALQVTEGARRAIEWRMFMGTYKGATDVVTKWVWPRPAFYVTKICARFGISPNMVTYLSLVLTIGAFIWFLEGAWAAGLIAGWLMTFLDTVDGKLARITLTSSKFGNALDHGIDLIHPPFWWVAWGIGVQNSPLALPEGVLFASLAVILAGYLLQRAMEGLSIWFFKIEIHVWRPVDTLFRQITARRNPNMVLLTLGALAGRPDLGLVAVASWTGLCLLLHGLQLLQAWSRWRRDGKLTSWMTEAAG